MRIHAYLLAIVAPMAQAQGTLVEWSQVNGTEAPSSQAPAEVPQGAPGVLTVYATRPDFDLVFPVVDQSCEDFEDANINNGDVIGFPAPLDSSTDTALFPAGSIVPGLVIQDDPLNDAGGASPDGLAAIGATAFGAPSDVVVANTFVDSLDLLFTTGPMGVAMDVFSFAAGGTATVSFFDQSDVFLGTVIVASLPTAGGFVGASSPVPIGRVNIVSVGETDQAEGGDDICFSSAPPQPRATFEVNKDFTDDNPAGVEVTISCNTGLPLEQSKVITEGAGVEFVVVDFDDGEMDCEITEDVPAGYDAEYFDGTSTSSVSCEYLDVEWGGAFACRITNSPAPVDVVIHKEWVIEGSDDANGVNQEFRIDLRCDSEIIGGNNYGNIWHIWWFDEGDATFIAEVVPDFPSTTCEVEETVFDSAVEVDNGCGQFEVSAANGHECTITNTVFFEGIPTLNQYGLALLALLMLGVGFVGFRRFA